MTTMRATLIVTTSAAICAVFGAILGILIGSNFPEYYVIVFRLGPERSYNLNQLGAVLGLTQGITAGVIIGLVIVLSVTWYEIQKLKQT